MVCEGVLFEDLSGIFNCVEVPFGEPFGVNNCAEALFEDLFGVNNNFEEVVCGVSSAAGDCTDTLFEALLGVDAYNRCASLFDVVGSWKRSGLEADLGTYKSGECLRRTNGDCDRGSGAGTISDCGRRRLTSDVVSRVEVFHDGNAGGS